MPAHCREALDQPSLKAESGTAALLLPKRREEAEGMMKAQLTTCAVLLTACAALATGTAHAGGCGNRLQSAVGTGAAFAGAGTIPYGLSGMFWNPAAVNLAEGFMTDSNFILVLPQSEITATVGTSPALLGLGAESGDLGIEA